MIRSWEKDEKYDQKKKKKKERGRTGRLTGKKEEILPTQ